MVASPVGFQGSNAVYAAPKGMTQEECVDLPVFADDMQVISCWRLTKEELANVMETGVVWISVWGHRVPPMQLSGNALVLVNDQPAIAEPLMPRAPRKG